MSVPAPHFLLFSEARRKSAQGVGAGRWRFVLEAVDGADKLEATDIEPGTAGDRLDLLAVVRGLEALDQPSRVTLVTTSRYVSEGLRYGLNEWRDTNWHWECFGKMVPIKNQDLWQRIDRALRIHQVECRALRFDGAENSDVTGPIFEAEPITSESERNTEACDIEPASRRSTNRRRSKASVAASTGRRTEPAPTHRFAWALNWLGGKQLNQALPVG